MSTLLPALAVEFRKTVAARMIRATTVLVALGIGLLAGALVAAARRGNEQVLGQLGPLANDQGWSLLTGVVAQITAAGALLAFGVALSWNIGREFADGTVSGLFALPIPREVIILAKLIIHLVWVILVAAALTLLVGIAGVVLDLGPIDSGVLEQLCRQFVLAALTGLLSVAAGWGTSLGRTMLSGFAATIALIVAAQASVLVSVDMAGWIPIAVPALWALQLTPISGPQMAIVGLVPVVFGTLTVISWRRLQLDK
ncbi:MAG: ABC transporter permease [Propionibacteriaceae bacterium]